MLANNLFDTDLLLIILAILIVTYLLVALVLTKVDDKENYSRNDFYPRNVWLGVGALAILFFLAISLTTIESRNNSIRVSECKQKVLPILSVNDANSIQDIEYILSRVCK